MNIFSFLDGIQIYQVIIIVAGLIFLIIEMFSPGFGVSGGIGLVLLIVGIIITASTPFEALVMFIMLLIVIGLVFVAVLRLAAKGKISGSLILKDKLNRESGFVGTEELEYYIGKEGVTVTTLRPAGIAEFDGVKLDVVTEGEYIPSGTKVTVIKVFGRSVVVRSI